GVDDGIHIAHVDGVGGDGARAGLVLGRVYRVLERCLVERFSSVFIEGALGVERLDVAVTAAEENPDHRPGSGRKQWPTSGRSPDRVCFLRYRARHAVPPEHRTERQPGEAHPDVGEESAARKAPTVTTAMWRGAHVDSE